jgi:hypothetical protein
MINAFNVLQAPSGTESGSTLQGNQHSDPNFGDDAVLTSYFSNVVLNEIPALLNYVIAIIWAI